LSTPFVTPTAPPQLRDYQQGLVDDIRGHFARGAPRICLQLATGGGKTICFAFIVAAAVAKSSRVLILIHRIELVEQIAATLARFGVPYGIIAAGYPETDAPVQVASVQTLVRRLDDIGAYDLVVIDEAHHAVAGTWRTILDAVPGAKVLGVTATPERLDGKGLGDVFDELVLGPDMRDLIGQVFLAPYVAFAPKNAPDLRRIKVTAGEGRPKEERVRYRDRNKQCEACGAFSPPKATHCQECGHAFAVRDKPRAERIDMASTLVEIQPAPALSLTARERANWLGMLTWIAGERGYKPGWIGANYRARFGSRPPQRSVPPIEPTREVRDWVRAQQRAFAFSQRVAS
jgi:superfamily II DNA or RNA helicase